MKSVGEVMAIGRTFQESIQKALRGLEVDVSGFDPLVDLDLDDAEERLRRELSQAGAQTNLGGWRRVSLRGSALIRCTNLPVSTLGS